MNCTISPKLTRSNFLHHVPPQIILASPSSTMTDVKADGMQLMKVYAGGGSTVSIIRIFIVYYHFRLKPLQEQELIWWKMGYSWSAFLLLIFPIWSRDGSVFETLIFTSTSSQHNNYDHNYLQVIPPHTTRGRLHATNGIRTILCERVNYYP